jgi:hypothetical protein
MNSAVVSFVSHSMISWICEVLGPYCLRRRPISEVLTFRSTFPSMNLRHLSLVKNGVIGGAFVHRADIQEIKKRDPIQTESLTSPYLIWVSYPVSSCSF